MAPTVVVASTAGSAEVVADFGPVLVLGCVLGGFGWARSAAGGVVRDVLRLTPSGRPWADLDGMTTVDRVRASRGSYSAGQVAPYYGPSARYIGRRVGLTGVTILLDHGLTAVDAGWQGRLEFREGDKVFDPRRAVAWQRALVWLVARDLTTEDFAWWMRHDLRLPVLAALLDRHPDLTLADLHRFAKAGWLSTAGVLGDDTMYDLGTVEEILRARIDRSCEAVGATRGSCYAVLGYTGAQIVAAEEQPVPTEALLRLGVELPEPPTR